MTVSKMDHALLSLAFLGNLSAPAKRNHGKPPPEAKSAKTKR
ncbi:hypothetical protein [Phenylobacterium sp.]|nr:hypothetical protein [Phenylobacterium sp.]